MKIAIFREDRFNENKFGDVSISVWQHPFKELILQNEGGKTISADLLSKEKDKKQFTILCLLTPSMLTITIKNIWKYIRLFLNYPANKKYFIALEPPVVSPSTYTIFFHKLFSRIYTRNDHLVDNKRYFKLIRPLTRKDEINETIPFSQKKFLVLINGNKASFRKNELYSERERAIRYYEKHYASDFDLYGIGRDRPNTKQRIFGYTSYPSYRGSVDDKIQTLSQYKFCICFENMKNIDGYITEKIRDCFKAKCVPIYRGAKNITKYIPENCFIDFRKFGNCDELTNYLQNITEKEYDIYINNISNFLQTEEANKRFDSQWAKDFLVSLQ